MSIWLLDCVLQLRRQEREEKAEMIGKKYLSWKSN